MKSEPNIADPNARESNGGKSQKTEPTYKLMQAAQVRYYQTITNVWNSFVERGQAIQTDYQRALEKAYQARDPNLVQSAQAEYSRVIQALYSDTSPIEQYRDAYREYKLDVQKAIAGANVDDLTFSDVAQISQSLYNVTWTAMCPSERYTQVPQT